MRSHRLLTATLIVGALLLMRVPTAGAWSNEAHSIVALVADRLLRTTDPALARSITKLLQSDNSNLTSATDIGTEATWADRFRDTPAGRSSSNWHFVDLDVDRPDLSADCFGRPKLQAGQLASEGPADDCVVGKIEQFAAELRSAATPPVERLRALQFLLHFVGDIHQPLHAAEHRITTNAAKRDFGGNCVGVLHGRANVPIRLHSYWDDNLVTGSVGTDPRRAADQIAASLTDDQKVFWGGGTPADWAKESHEIAVTVTYNQILNVTPVATFQFKGRNGQPDTRCGVSDVFRLNNDYDMRARETVKEQLAKAGVRLAWLLRENFTPR